ncbi:MAG: phosphoglucosamine mutase [Gemmatimonadales bacterium]
MTGTLMAGVSGVRGIVGTDLTPEVVARYAAAFGRLAAGAKSRTVVLARDSRASGPAFAVAARVGLEAVGARVIDCGLIPTPTAQLAVTHHEACGAVVITASHNPVEWNALKFVGSDGIFLDGDAMARLFEIERGGDLPPISLDRVGETAADSDAVRRHIDAVMALDVVDVAAVTSGGFTVVLDCVRGAGGTVMPELLERLGCRVVGLDLEPDGRFPRAPEPVPENLVGLGELVRREGADLGVAVDPDADRLAIVDEHGTPIGEDYTLAFAVQTVLERRVGPVVANLSTSLVVDDAAREFGIEVQRAPVGEVNVARAMERAGAVVGGEGNGGVMLPALHLGRDAPLAAALVLDLLARTGATVSRVVAGRPRYVIVKARSPRRGDLEEVYERLERCFPDAERDRQDGLRLGWADRWLHVRPSGTEPIVRLIAEAPSADLAESLATAVRDAMAA